MNNIDELIEQLRPFAEYHELHWPDHIGPSTVQYVVRETITALREQQANAIMLEAARDHELEANRKLQERIVGLVQECERQHVNTAEQFDRAELAERQRNAALEALEQLAKSPTPAGKYWKDFANDALQRIRGMK